MTKAIDRFSLAIGLVINMLIDPDDAVSKKKESYCQTSLGPVVSGLADAGILVENVEYLRGETHYIAVTVKKVSLLPPSHKTCVPVFTPSSPRKPTQ